MKLIDRWETRLRPYAVPNVTAGLIAIQVVVFFLAMSRPTFRASCQLIREKVLEGEVWRLASFLFVPPRTNIIFAFFFWYLFYLMGTTLENQWGTVRYNLYLLIGYVANVCLAMLVPVLPASNMFLYGSVFLAFAQLYPDFTLNLYFILPIKIKWLAWITWLTYGWQFLMGGWMARLLVTASVADFLLFFGRSIYDHIRLGQRRMVRSPGSETETSPAAHVHDLRRHQLDRSQDGVPILLQVRRPPVLL